MKVVDLNQTDVASALDTDICIIGSGPAGLSITNELIGTKNRVLVLESGGEEDEPDAQALNQIESTGAPRVMDQELVRYRILGGTSHIWTGRCAPFDVSDFECRSWIPYSGWPLTRADLEPYLGRAANYLGLGPILFDQAPWQQFNAKPPDPPLQAASLRPMFWQFSKLPNGTRSVHFGRDWTAAEAPNIEILTHANVTHINLTSDGSRLDSLEVSTLGGKRIRIKSKTAVVCCGAIENARLLLASNRASAEGVGNKNDLVGRFLMDHTTVALASFPPSRSYDLRARFGHYWLDDARGRHVYLHGVGLSEKAQAADRLLNCHAYFEDIGHVDNDPWDALKRLKSSVRSRRVSLADARLVLAHAGEIGKGLYRRRFQHRPQLPPVKRVEIQLMLEQMPDPESRVTLSEAKRDALGMPISRIHWKISDTERLTANRMARAIGQEFKILRLPLPEGLSQWQDTSDWASGWIERAHPSGTTRMSNNPNEGVVDANCQVHGVRGLFVAGSSVFPTSGAANPTLMIVATALRLADHLKAAI